MTDFPERMESEDEAAHLARVQAWMKGSAEAQAALGQQTITLSKPLAYGDKIPPTVPPPPLIMDAATVKAIADMGWRAGAAEADLASIRSALVGATTLVEAVKAVVQIAHPSSDMNGWRDVCPALHRAAIETMFAPKEPA